MSDAAARVREEILNNPDFWRTFVPANFVHPRTLDPNYTIPNRGQLLTSLVIYNCVVGCLVVVSRLYSRLFVVRRSFNLDDWLIIPAFITFVSCATLMLLGVKKNTIGKHIYDCTPDEIIAWFWILFGLDITSRTTIFLTRMSILCFLWSLAGNVEKISRIAIACIQGINFFVWLATMLPLIVRCAPEFRAWDLPVMIMSRCLKAGTLDKIKKIAVGMSFCGVLVDFAILVVPIRLVWKLKLPVRQRFIVSGLFAVGGLACIAAICKAIYIHAATNRGQLYDSTWTYVNIFIAIEFEQSLALVTACGPGLKPLFSRATAYISDTFYGTSKLGFGSGPTAQPCPCEEDPGAVVTIGGGGNRGKKSRGQGELVSTARTFDDGVGNRNGDFLMAELESGQGAEGVSSLWQGEVEGLDNVQPVYDGVQKVEQIPKE